MIRGKTLLRGRWGAADAVQGRTLALLLDAATGQVCWTGEGSQRPPAELVGAADELLEVGGEEQLLAPGLVDLHVHGAAGHDFADGTPSAFAAIAAYHARCGTTALCATILASSPEATLKAIEAGREHQRAVAGEGARVVGLHLEGPFLAPERAGAQPPEHLRLPDPILLDEFLAAAQGTLRVVTLAPELPGALALVERLVDAGVLVSMGHSSATYEQACRGADAGCRLGCHAFNAMRGLHHREPGLAGALLVRDELSCEVIADGHHVAGPVLELLWRLKGPQERLALITDCTAALDAPAGRARLGDRPVQVQDGAVRLADGTLAGSALTMANAVEGLVTLSSASFAQALGAASRTPGALVGATVGKPEVGAPADFLVYDALAAPGPSPRWRLEQVFVAGQPQISRKDVARDEQ